MSTTETIKSIESALKNNNEWFYDRPTTDDKLEAMYRLASSYATLCHKWTILNRAATDAFNLIKTQQQTIIELEAKIATLTKETA
jgi:hypothetical protein